MVEADLTRESDGNGKRLSVLLLADDCNPEWPSLPIVGYKYALALGRVARVVVATHVRNRENILKAAPQGVEFVFLDNERIASPLHKLALWLRGGSEVAWSTNMIMQYLPYLAFEREAWKHFRKALRAGEFDLVHRITPMTPTLPSYIAGKLAVPFVIGPLNGNLPWPREFRSEQKRERERLRVLRDVAKHLPYARGTYRNAALVLAGFEHTMRELRPLAPGRVVNFPEIGYDPAIFHAVRKVPAFGGPGPYRFLFAGRLVPYKLPDVAVLAFAGAPELAGHSLHIVGDGPEMPRLREIVAQHGLEDTVHFEGRRSQAELAGMMRDFDGFVFPSIRELGAGVVIEAMACGMTCFVADYGAPGHLAGRGRGVTVPIRDHSGYVAQFRQVLAGAVADPATAAARAAAGQGYAEALYPWDRKAQETLAYYRDLLAGRPVQDRGDYD
ncbi:MULTISPECIES: glycosyltransferase family 4 protein [Paracoccus]|jgi:glycosyltransferase involved in cell wall biosynthesis|uniref:glycosyltransferase family 4 protein n=1 Tax=Paracoccus TaxID=265 RepID=UPI001E2F9D5C|nr:MULTISPECIES: glycosyltransferase [Paracoccus]UFS67661.1 glycosyltransferase [Paracoccus denitrificans]